jgi:integrase
MSLFKRCTCKNRDRCDDPWLWRVQVNGSRQSGKIDEFAAWYGEDDEARKPVRQKSVAKAWESRIRQAIRKGIDPTVAPAPPVAVTTGLTIGDYIASTYLPKHVDITKEMTDVGREDKRSKCRVLATLVGALPFAALSTAEPLEVIKQHYANNPAATGHRYLAALRALINWARDHNDFTGESPFDKKSNKFSKQYETERDRRLVPGEWERLLATCESLASAPRGASKMTWPVVREIRALHAQGTSGRELALRFGITASLVSEIVNERVWRPDTERASGLALRDRLVGARATCLRQGEMLRVQNRHVYWDQGLLVIPKNQFNTVTLRDVLNTKGLKGRAIPFLDDAGQPLDAELLEILMRRRTLGPFAYIWGDWESGKKVSDFSTTWYVLLLLANDHRPAFQRNGGLAPECWEAIKRIDLHWHDLRHEGLSRYGELGVSTRALQLLAGHASIQTTLRYEHVTTDRLRAEMAKATLEESRSAPKVAPDCHEPAYGPGALASRTA